MTSALRTTLAAAVLAATVLLSSCAKELTPPVTVGDLPADVGPAISLDRELDRYGSFETWPSACELVTDGTLQALLPQATDIARLPESRDYEMTAPDMTKIPGAGLHVPEARCAVSFRVPVGMLASNPVRLHIDILVAGSKDFVKLNRDHTPTTPLDLAGGGTCGVAADAIRCLDASGRIFFVVNFTLPHHGPSLKDPSRYDHAGDVVTFTTGKDDDVARNAYVNEHLTYPIVASILSRLGGS